ncbi:D-aminoacyl-tRNA deacylase 1 isoform X2 [Alligator sinensis]|uniref:D-aminoacyl-tRNA deacylase n=1 Tax=Alligator sinensis TaxID=38654 RepID=A0A3Q0HBT1_ALLSI|nr:D-aminoacyl-tRNA deacylase 1 isoform X2 [Alligator sinensis]
MHGTAGPPPFLPRKSFCVSSPRIGCTARPVGSAVVGEWALGAEGKMSRAKAELWRNRFAIMYALSSWSLLGYVFYYYRIGDDDSLQRKSNMGGEQISSIGRGICVLLGISLEDTQRELEHMVRKILNLRVFEDESGKHWSKSVMDKQYEVLCVSQFTLQCILKGNKPDYHMAMPSEQSEPFYNNFLEQLRKAYKPELIKGGKFGAYMQVHIQNDGPVTIELESPAATVDPKQLVPIKSMAASHKQQVFCGISGNQNFEDPLASSQDKNHRPPQAARLTFPEAEMQLASLNRLLDLVHCLRTTVHSHL